MAITLDGTLGISPPTAGTQTIAPVLMAAQASTAGTSIDFTGIPVGVKRITVMFNAVSTNGTSNPLIQLGSGSAQTTGYSSTTASIAGTTAAATQTNGFNLIVSGGTAAYTYHGHITFTNLSGNIWTCSGAYSLPNVAQAFVSGAVTLTGTLDRIRVTTANGTDTFDAGSISVLYE